MIKHEFTLNVDYGAVAEYLKETYFNPEVQEMRFDEVRGILARHVDSIMDIGPDLDPELTERLFMNHVYGHVAEIIISSTLGYIHKSEGINASFPLILIRIED